MMLGMTMSCGRRPQPPRTLEQLGLGGGVDGGARVDARLLQQRVALPLPTGRVVPRPELVARLRHGLAARRKEL